MPPQLIFLFLCFGIVRSSESLHEVLKPVRYSPFPVNTSEQLEIANTHISQNRVNKGRAVGLGSRKDLLRKGRPPPERKHELIFAIKQKNLDDLRAVLHRVSDPKSSEYGRYWTYGDVGAYTKNTEAQEKTSAILLSLGAEIVATTPHGDYITARAPISLWEDVLSTEFFIFHQDVQQNEHREFVRTDHYSLPAELDRCVESVFNTVQMPWRIKSQSVISPMNNIANLVREEQYQQQQQEQDTTEIGISPLSDTNNGRHGVRMNSEFGSGNVQITSKICDKCIVTPKLLNSHYHITTNTGTNQSTQAVFETNGQYMSPSDLNKFQTKFALPKQAALNYGGYSSDSACTTNANNCNEGNLDIQYMMAVSQTSPTTYWYSNANTFSEFLVDVASKPNPPLVFSISWSENEIYVDLSEQNAFQTQAIKLGLMGVTIVASAGDDGVSDHAARDNPASCAYSAQFPASCPYVTAVGATQGPESNKTEVVCQSNLGGTITSGGGFSNLFSRPSWQDSHVSEYITQITSGSITVPYIGFNTTGRGYPDISLVGVNYMAYIGGESFLLGGSSASAPVFAGMVSLLNAARLSAGGSAMGWMNPFLYGNYKKFANDITSGDNRCTAVGGSSTSVTCCAEGFYAGKGWDPTTGVGSVDFEKLHEAALEADNPDFVKPTRKPTKAPVSASPTPVPVSPNTPIAKVAVTLSLSGVDVTAAQTQTFQDALVISIATAVNVDSSSVKIVSISQSAKLRRGRLALANGGSASSGGGGVAVTYTVTTTRVSSTKLSSQLQSQTTVDTVAQQLSAAGYSGVAVTSQPTVVDISPTASPTAVGLGGLASSSGPLGGGKGSGGGCFSAQDTCQLEDGTVKLISDVEIGERILSADASGRLKYSEVIAVPHKTNNIPATFVELVTSSGREIKMTPYHMIPVGDCSAPVYGHHGTPLSSDIMALVAAPPRAAQPAQVLQLNNQLTYAKDISAGMCVHTVLGPEEVVEVRHLHMKGVYTVVTQDEFVVVNGIVASPFAISHTFPHILYNIHRMFAFTFPLFPRKFSFLFTLPLVQIVT